MRKLHSCELEIMGGRHTKDGYVSMDHGQKYKIRVKSGFWAQDCDCIIRVDGKEVGTWRLSPRGAATIERPVNDTGQFTFYASGSKEALISDESNISAQDSGLVTAEFVPGKEPTKAEVLSAVDTKGGGITKGSGLSGLSGRSRQRFGRAALIERDESQAVKITVRLFEDDSCMPVPIRDVRETSVPSPV